jgi:hypothetical protein
MAEIKAIETAYNGYRFRSRREARWAVFFDNMGIQYEYEPEGFVLEDGTRYLPDFRVNVSYKSHSSVWVEVKGVFDESSKHKAELFSKGYPLLVVGDIPKSLDSVFDYNEFNFFMYRGEGYMHSTFVARKGCVGEEGLLFVKDHCLPPYYDEYYTNECFQKARSARFEYGETPHLKSYIHTRMKQKSQCKNDKSDLLNEVNKSVKALHAVALQPDLRYVSNSTYLVSFTKEELEKRKRYDMHLYCCKCGEPIAGSYWRVNTECLCDSCVPRKEQEAYYKAKETLDKVRGV